jgi:pimeloyl-ACP methyl ester carboxylesterase
LAILDVAGGGAGLPGTMSASIYKSPRGRAEILRLYDEAAARLGVEYSDLTVGTRFGETHVLAAGPEDAPPVMVLPGGNFLNPTCLGWFLPLARDNRLYAPDIVGQPGKSAQERPRADGHAWWVEDVLDGLGLERPPLVGVSYGAGIALRAMGYAPERVSRAALVVPSGIATGSTGRMLLEVMVPMLLYRLHPTRERMLRAARPLLTEPDEDFARQLGAVYRHVRLDAQLPHMATEEELRGFRGPAAVFAAGDDPFFPGEAVLARAREIFANLAYAECLQGCRHVPSKAALGRVNQEIRAFLGGSDAP